MVAEGDTLTFPLSLDAESRHTFMLEPVSVGDTMRASIDGKPVAFLRSTGIAHPTKSKVEFGCMGKDGGFDDLYIWNAEPVAKKNLCRIGTLPPQKPRKLLRHGLAVFGPFAGEEGGPVGGGGEAFVVGGVEAEEDGEAAFAEGGMGGEGEAVVEFDLGFGFVVEVRELERAVVGSGDGEG